MAWFRYRSAAFLTGLLATALLLAAMAAIPLQPKSVDWVDVLQVGGVFVMPCVVLVLLGPALAVWMRGRAWPVRGELAGILCALLLGMAASVATFFQLTKPYEAARVDLATGKRVIHFMPQVKVMCTGWPGRRSPASIRTRAGVRWVRRSARPSTPCKARRPSWYALRRAAARAPAATRR